MSSEIFPRFLLHAVLWNAILWNPLVLVNAAGCVHLAQTTDQKQVQDSSPALQKKTRSSANQKINSLLLNAIRQRQGQAGKHGVPSKPIKLRTDEQGRVLVDIRAIVSQQLTSRIEALGGKVVSTAERYQSTIAYLPLECLEKLATFSDVRFIVPAAESATH